VHLCPCCRGCARFLSREATGNGRLVLDGRECLYCFVFVDHTRRRACLVGSVLPHHSTASRSCLHLAIFLRSAFRIGSRSGVCWDVCLLKRTTSLRPRSAGRPAGPRSGPPAGRLGELTVLVISEVEDHDGAARLGHLAIAVPVSVPRAEGVRDGPQEPRAVFYGANACAGSGVPGNLL
jgi:hypothetical protein